MKKIIITLLSALVFLPITVEAAASYTLSAPASVENGNSVTATLTLKQTAAWDVKIISAGSTTGCTQSFVDVTNNGKNTTKTLSVTCKSSGTGIISFTATGKITNENYEVTNVSITKKVNVVPPREKSNDDNLAFLSVEGFELNPKFDKDTTEYTVNAPSTVDKIKIEAKTNESHASLTGTGEFEVTEGINTFKVVVTSETGKEKTYTINVNVEDQNPIEITIDGKKYTVVKNEKSLTEPNLFEKTTIKIEDFDIPAFYNDTANMTLVGIKDEDGNIKLAIYDNNSYKIYTEFKNASLNLYLTNFKEEIKNYIKTTITIDDNKIEAYKYKDNSRFAIVYAMNLETGEYNYYSYDTKEKTFQIWNQEQIPDLEKDIKTFKLTTYVFGGGLLFAFILVICVLCSKNKKKKSKKVESKKTAKEEIKTEEKNKKQEENLDIEEEKKK